MNNQSSSGRPLALTLAVLALCFFAVSISHAWTSPTATPPGNDVAAPLNVSSNAQGKLGNVGIGMTTTPLTNLDVYNSSSASQYIRTDSSALKFVGTGGTNYIESGSSTTADSKADLKFTSMDGTTPFVTIQGSTGNVGIGTTSPASGTKLNIVGGGAASIDLSVNGRIQTGDANGAGGFFTNGTTDDSFVGNNFSSSNNINNVGFWTNGVGWSAFNIVKSNGYVGINTQAPTTNLDVAGLIRIRGGNPAAGSVLKTDANGLAYWGNCTGGTGATGPQGQQGATGPQGPAGAGPTSSFCFYADRKYASGTTCKVDCVYNWRTCATGGSTEYDQTCNSNGVWSVWQNGHSGCGCPGTSC